MKDRDAWRTGSREHGCAGRPVALDAPVLARGQTTSVKSIRLSWLHRRQRTSSSSAAASNRIDDPGRRFDRAELPHAPFLAGEPMRRAIGFLEAAGQLAMRRFTPTFFSCPTVLSPLY